MCIYIIHVIYHTYYVYIIYIYTYIYIYIHIYIHIYIYIYNVYIDDICMYIHTYIYNIYILYIHIQLPTLPKKHWLIIWSSRSHMFSLKWQWHWSYIFQKLARSHEINRSAGQSFAGSQRPVSFASWEPHPRSGESGEEVWNSRWSGYLKHWPPRWPNTIGDIVGRIAQ